jgi:hypothetical protein
MKLTHRLRAVASLIERHDLPFSHLSGHRTSGNVTVYTLTRPDFDAWVAAVGVEPRRSEIGLDGSTEGDPFVAYELPGDGFTVHLFDNAEARRVLRQRARTADRRTVGAVA